MTTDDLTQRPLTDECEAAAEALRRLWPLIERGMRGYVFTAAKAGEVAADMGVLRKAAAEGDDRVSDLVAAERARIADLEAQCEAGAASEQRWIDWLVAHGLLHYYSACHRPDGTHGPAWVLRTPRIVDGGACEAWHPASAVGALRRFLSPDPGAKEG